MYVVLPHPRQVVETRTKTLLSSSTLPMSGVNTAVGEFNAGKEKNNTGKLSPRLGRVYGCIAMPGGAGLGTYGTRFRFGGAKWRRG